MNQWVISVGLGILLAIFISIIVAFVGAGRQWLAAHDRAGERRIADARMNARLLRLNI